MKVLFHGMKPFVGLESVVLLCIVQLSLLSLPAHSQERDSIGEDNRKMFYGVHLGYIGPRVDFYYTQNGQVHALEQSDHSIYASGLRLAVVGGVRLGRQFSLRVMPGVTTFRSSWESDNMALPSASYRVESVCGELPVDVKFHTCRWDKVAPFLTCGISNSFDFASLHNGSDEVSVHQLNAYDLRVTIGWGVDFLTRYLGVCLEFKASFGLIPLRTSVANPIDDFYFRSSPSFNFGINFET